MFTLTATDHTAGAYGDVFTSTHATLAEAHARAAALDCGWYAINGVQYEWDGKGAPDALGTINPDGTLNLWDATLNPVPTTGTPYNPNADTYHDDITPAVVQVEWSDGVYNSGPTTVPDIETAYSHVQSILSLAKFPSSILINITEDGTLTHVQRGYDVTPMGVHRKGEPLPTECPSTIFMHGEVWERTPQQWERISGGHPAALTEMDDAEVRNITFAYTL